MRWHLRTLAGAYALNQSWCHSYSSSKGSLSSVVGYAHVCECKISSRFASGHLRQSFCYRVLQIRAFVRELVSALRWPALKSATAFAHLGQLFYLNALVVVLVQSCYIRAQMSSHLRPCAMASRLHHSATPLQLTWAGWYKLAPVSVLMLARSRGRACICALASERSRQPALVIKIASASKQKHSHNFISALASSQLQQNFFSQACINIFGSTRLRWSACTITLPSLRSFLPAAGNALSITHLRYSACVRAIAKALSR